MTAIEAFENMVKDYPVYKVAPEYFLKKLESTDPLNPEFLDRVVDSQWQMFREGWLARESLHTATK